MVLRANLSGCHAKIPSASFFSMLAIISLKISRPALWRFAFHKFTDDIQVFLFGIFSQFKHLRLNTQNLPFGFVRGFAGIEKIFWFVNLCCPYCFEVSFWAIKEKYASTFRLWRKKRLVCKISFCQSFALRTSALPTDFVFGFPSKMPSN